MMLVLVLEHLEQIVVHQKVVELLEFFQRVLIVLTGALRQDVHLEVGLSDLRLISLLVARRILLSLTLEGLLHTDARLFTSQSVIYSSWRLKPYLDVRFISYNENQSQASFTEKFKYLKLT